mmetsp:Transcript_6448/g.23967  ORF Transcript_6448/g.23967 Transcript_6448/m.23967 type:complete len:173 (+) Transcript_6448:43-561(+)
MEVQEAYRSRRPRPLRMARRMELLNRIQALAVAGRYSLDTDENRKDLPRRFMAIESLLQVVDEDEVEGEDGVRDILANRRTRHQSPTMKACGAEGDEGGTYLETEARREMVRRHRGQRQVGKQKGHLPLKIFQSWANRPHSVEEAEAEAVLRRRGVRRLKSHQAWSLLTGMA